MAGSELFFLIFEVLGGLALFIFGMNVMTDGLRHAAGTGLRRILARTTSSRVAGITLGTILGFLVHSSATTVMLVGFVNAGLMSLLQSIPPMLGANIGTSISMQVISFKLDKYCYFAITAGFILTMALPHAKGKQLGRALLGFGLLFLGMKTMSGAIKPHRELLAPLLQGIDGSTLPGMLLGVGVSLAVTGIIQSSGATIGMCYALIGAGVFTQFEQVFPIVLGAHIGTCATALLGSIGTNIEARRTAISHLAFNVLNVIFAIAASKFFFWLIPLTSSDLTHQTANLHTAVMLIASMIVLPVSKLHEKLVRFITPSRKKPPEPSFLEEDLLTRPEQAIYASINELQRIVRRCAQSFRFNADIIFKRDRDLIQQVRLNEKVINEIKLAMKDYLSSLTSHYLSRRQAILIQHIERCMADIERIGDHIDALTDLSEERRDIPEARFNRDQLEWLFTLYEKAAEVLHNVIESLNPDFRSGDFQKMAQTILQTRDEYAALSMATKDHLFTALSEKNMAPIAGMFFRDYISAMDKVVKHSKSIALVELQPQFWIKRKKLGREAKESPEFELPQLSDPNDFLDKLQKEDTI
ncbi:MAG: Na/Pi symporter [Verrucomicrobia bacterium]|nr:Na/Pi symporter [Verrucomicrobiota bacterium]